MQINSSIIYSIWPLFLIICFSLPLKGIAHGSRMTQRWIQAHIPAFISKEEWPSRSPDLNPLDFSVWSILESKACRTSHDSLENLNSKLQREWALITQEVLCASCNVFQGRLKQIIKPKGGHIE